jgi:peptidyl-dipeptidase A
MDSQPQIPSSKKPVVVTYEQASLEPAEFANKLEEQLSKLYNASASAAWKASLTGKDEDFEASAKADMAMNEFLSDPSAFNSLKYLKNNITIEDPLVKRRIEVLFNTFAACQIPAEDLNRITLLQNEISKKFQNFRAIVNGKELTDNEIEDILKNSKDSKELEAAWRAHKEIGHLVNHDIIELVKLRNDAARKLGYSNYHQMSLILSEQDPDEILRLFDELDDLTRNAYASVKKDIDNVLSKECNIKPEEMMPWHYQNRYFQEAPKIYDVDLDKYYAKKDIVKLTEDYYSSIGLDIKDMVANSDLFEKPGKYQHAYCTDIDRNKGDIRVVCNIKPNANWMSTTLHEFGHAVYSKYHDRKLPWILKTAAHTFTTEAIAILFERYATNPYWMVEMGLTNNKEAQKIAENCDKTLRLEQLVFSRWSQVMYRFEKSMYENPDQDLNSLWWKLVEEYQLMKCPEGRNEPDWATKIHIATVPCYYHNYLIGNILASQLYYFMKNNFAKEEKAPFATFYNNKKIGKYLIENVFAPGAKYQWNEMIKRATGEYLTAKYYAKQFVEK